MPRSIPRQTTANKAALTNTCPAPSSIRHDHFTINPQSKPRPRAGVGGLRRSAGNSMGSHIRKEIRGYSDERLAELRDSQSPRDYRELAKEVLAERAAAKVEGRTEERFQESIAVDRSAQRTGRWALGVAFVGVVLSVISIWRSETSPPQSKLRLLPDNTSPSTLLPRPPGHRDDTPATSAPPAEPTKSDESIPDKEPPGKEAIPQKEAS